MIMPGWQYPHWATSSSIQALWQGWSPEGRARPSIVVKAPAAAAARLTWQERTGLPPWWIVHAPQTPIPQPYFVPRRPSRSRRIQRSGVSPGSSTLRKTPFTVSEIRVIPSLE